MKIALNYPRSLAAFAAAAFLLFVPVQTMAQKDTSTLTPQQKQEVQKLIGEYLRTNPQIILEAIEILRSKERQSQDTKSQKNIVNYQQQLYNDPTSPVGGNPKGDVTIVEFFDYRCSFCKRVFPLIMSLLKQDKNVRYVFKELPILTPESEIAARAALAAWRLEKDKYLGFHIKLMGSHGKLSEKRIMRMAESVGLDTAKIRQEMKSPAVEKALRNNFELARNLGATGTPAFVIGGQFVPGAVDLSTIKRLIADARKRG